MGSKTKGTPREANERASAYEITCFDHTIGTYQVEHRSGTTSDGEVRELRMHVESSKISHALVVNQGSTSFYVLIWWQQLGIATIISRA